MNSEKDVDINGKISSKRYWAKRFFTLGFWLYIFFIVAWIVVKFFLKEEFEIPQALVDMWTWMMGFASAVVLGTVLEKPKNNINKHEEKGD